MSPNLSRPPVPPWSSEPALSTKPGQPSTPRSNSFQRTPGGGPLSSLPINLSLSEDERSPNRSNSDATSPHFAKMVAVVASAQKSSEDDEEQLYEYFPLSLDDWWVIPFTFTIFFILFFLPWFLLYFLSLSVVCSP